MSKKFTEVILVVVDDWEGLYIDGILVHEDNWMLVDTAFGHVEKTGKPIKFRSAEAPPSVLIDGRFPKELPKRIEIIL